MANLMNQRTGLAPVVGPNPLLAADHPNRGEAQAIMVFPHEPNIIGLIRARHQVDGRVMIPLGNGVVNAFRLRDVGIDDEGNHAARPAVAIWIERSIGGLNLIERKEAKTDSCGDWPQDTSHADALGMPNGAFSFLDSKTIYRTS